MNSTSIPNEITGEKRVEDEFVENVDAGMNEAAYAPEYANYSQAKTIAVFWRSVVFASAMAVGAIFDCYALTAGNSLLANPGFVLQFGRATDANGNTAMRPNDLSNWTLILSIGCIAALPVGGFIGDKLGRKWTLYTAMLFLVAVCVLSITASDFATWSARAFLAGASQGFIQSGLVPYLAEIAPPKIRGLFLSMYSFFWGLGILAGTVANYVASETDPFNWKAPLYGQFVFLGLWVPGLLLAPETPWYTARQGHEAKAKKAMKWLYGNVPGYDIDQEYNIITRTINNEPKNTSQGIMMELKLYGEIFRGVDLRRTLVATLPMTTQAFSGVMLFYGYTVYFFEQAGYAKPFEANMIFGCCSTTGTLISFFVLDYFGRRPMMLFGVGCCLVFCWALGGIAFSETPSGPGMVALACLWVGIYSTSLGPLGYNSLGELTSPRLKARTASIGFLWYAALQLALGYLVPYMLSPLEWGWGLKTGLFFGATCTVAWVLLFFFFPESKGRTAEELNEMFKARVGARQFGSYTTAVQRKAESQEQVEAV